jgi:hypothetical protein
MVRFRFLPMLLTVQTSSASAEVCDKFKEDWRIGDLPVWITPLGGWPLFSSPLFLLSLVATIGIAILVWKRRCKAAAALWFSGAWALATIGAVAVGIAEASSEAGVIEMALREGCIRASWTGGVEFPLICMGFALTLGLFWYRQRAHQALRN